MVLQGVRVKRDWRWVQIYTEIRLAIGRFAKCRGWMHMLPMCLHVFFSQFSTILLTGCGYFALFCIFCAYADLCYSLSEAWGRCFQYMYTSRSSPLYLVHSFRLLKMLIPIEAQKRSSSRTWKVDEICIWPGLPLPASPPAYKRSHWEVPETCQMISNYRGILGSYNIITHL